MKIAFVLEVFPSLSQTFVLNQVTDLIDQGHDVDIYAEVRGDSHKVHPDVDKYRLLERTHYQPTTPVKKLQRFSQGLKLFLGNLWKDPSLILGSVNVLRHGKAAASLRLLHAAIPFVGQPQTYDIILCHFGLLGLKGMMLRRIGALQGKLITVFHGVDMSQNLRLLGEDLYAPLFEAGDIFLPISNHWQKRLEQLGCDRDKIMVHHMGIDLKKFQFQPRYLAPGSEPRLISVCRLTEKKGLEFGIKAVATLIKQGLELEYVIIGGGNLKPALETLIQDLGVAQSIKLLGPQSHPEVVQQLSKSHILLAPSVTATDGNQEGIPVILMEAMAMGMPVVSSYHTGIPELVEDGISGYLTPERDVTALSSKILSLIESPDHWPSMGKSGCERVQAEYEIHSLNQRLAQLFEQQLHSPKLAASKPMPTSCSVD